MYNLLIRKPLKLCLSEGDTYGHFSKVLYSTVYCNIAATALHVMSGQISLAIDGAKCWKGEFSPRQPWLENIEEKIGI